MSRLSNYSGLTLEDQTYYSIQFGLILTIAYHCGDQWFIPGELPIYSSKLREDLIVIDKICTQSDISKPHI
jgi:hypothetical protein